MYIVYINEFCIFQALHIYYAWTNDILYATFLDFSCFFCIFWKPEVNVLIVCICKSTCITGIISMSVYFKSDIHTGSYVWFPIYVYLHIDILWYTVQCVFSCVCFSTQAIHNYHIVVGSILYFVCLIFLWQHILWFISCSTDNYKICCYCISYSCCNSYSL